MNLKSIRTQIDEIDKEMISLLNRRFDLVKKIGKLKRKEDKPILDIKREEKILAKLSKKINALSLQKVFRQILKESRNIQKKLDARR